MDWADECSEKRVMILSVSVITHKHDKVFAPALTSSSRDRLREKQAAEDDSKRRSKTTRSKFCCINLSGEAVEMRHRQSL